MNNFSVLLLRQNQNRYMRALREAGATSAPMTYLHEGRQYVVLAIGGTGHAAEWVAFGLP